MPSAAVPRGASAAPPSRSPRSSSAPWARRVSSASSVETRPPDSVRSAWPMGSAAATPGTSASAPPCPNCGVRLASTRTAAPARKSAWSSCERSQEAPWPIDSMPSAPASTSSSTGPAPRFEQSAAQ
ncbi:hypothetical protein ACWFRN_37125, partial [Streptomyces celluloflavus]